MLANILVAAIDGLRASALGAYGNTSFPTPALDRFAAESLLLDNCYAPSVNLNDNYRALWHSTHPARTTPGDISLPRMLAERGYATTFITDEPLLNSLAAIGDFNKVSPVCESLPVVGRGVRASDLSQTEIARLFTAATAAVESRSNGPQLIWLHTRGMYGAWDAPLAFQQSLLDEGDPPPVDSSTVPDFVIESDDPDAAFRYTCAYAAQAMVLDACWDSLLDTINAASADPWLVVLIGARGFPLGEHDRIGGVDPRLYTEQLHVPWLIRFPNSVGRLARSSALTSPLDLLPTVIDWTNGDMKSDRSAFDGMSILPFARAVRTSWRDAILSTSASTRAIRTAEWCLREDLATNGGANALVESSSSAAELYVRPDDRWEANDVTKLCPDAVEELRAAMTGALQRIAKGEPITASSACARI